MGRGLNILMFGTAMAAASCGVSVAETGAPMDTQPPAAARRRPGIEWMSPGVCTDLEVLAGAMRGVSGGPSTPEAAGKVAIHITRNPDGSHEDTRQNHDLERAVVAAAEADSLARDRSFDATQRKIQASGTVGSVIGYNCVGVHYPMPKHLVPTTLLSPTTV